MFKHFEHILAAEYRIEILVIRNVFFNKMIRFYTAGTIIPLVRLYRWYDYIKQKKKKLLIKQSDILQLNSIIIETVETYRQEYFLRKFVSESIPLLFVGPTGTGKSAITNCFLRGLPKKEYTVCNVNFSAQTSASQTQDMIFSKLDR